MSRLPLAPKNRATPVAFAHGPSSLGTVLAVFSAQGVCAIALGDDPESMLAALHSQFGAGDWAVGDGQHAAWLAKVIRLVENEDRVADFPLDIQGTAFQLRVWEALREIPPGAMASYAAVARRLGSPRSARAVAQACAANPLAVAIPCHRVVCGDGSLSGYRWGVGRKRQLLRREALLQN